MSKSYTKEDIRKVSYREFGSWLNKLELEVKNVIKKKKIEIDMIVPILRS